MFQSYLYGIEIDGGAILAKERLEFQSYLYGIEMGLTYLHIVRNTVSIVPLWNWNKAAKVRYRRRYGFNRTFMELKFRNTTLQHCIGCVSIVPLWNWNCLRLCKLAARDGFNRTFMELKLSSLLLTVYRLQRFNRTFMELKLRLLLPCGAVCLVSIVPLWNWNMDLLVSLKCLILFQSYLYGIEIPRGRASSLVLLLFQSYLYGIEIR